MALGWACNASIRADREADCQATAPVRRYKGLEPCEGLQILRMPDLEVEVWQVVVTIKSKGRSRSSSNYSCHTVIHV